MLKFDMLLTQNTNHWLLPTQHPTSTRRTAHHWSPGRRPKDLGPSEAQILNVTFTDTYIDSVHITSSHVHHCTPYMVHVNVKIT